MAALVRARPGPPHRGPANFVHRGRPLHGSQLGVIQGLEALADMIGNSIQAPMEGHEAEAREEHARGMSGAGVSVEVVTPIESFHQFYRYSYIWHFPDGSSSGGTSFCEQAADGRIRLITAWPASDHFAIPPSARA